MIKICVICITSYIILGQCENPGLTYRHLKITIHTKSCTKFTVFWWPKHFKWPTNVGLIFWKCVESLNLMLYLQDRSWSGTCCLYGAGFESTSSPPAGGVRKGLMFLITMQPTAMETSCDSLHHVQERCLCSILNKTRSPVFFEMKSIHLCVSL